MIESLVHLHLQIDDEAQTPACSGATEDTPLGAQQRRLRRTEPK
jgi:hypothetical protein